MAAKMAANALIEYFSGMCQLILLKFELNA